MYCEREMLLGFKRAWLPVMSVEWPNNLSYKLSLKMQSLCAVIVNFIFAEKDKCSWCADTRDDCCKHGASSWYFTTGKGTKLSRSFCMSHWLANFLLAADFLDVISKGILDLPLKKNTSILKKETYTFRRILAPLRAFHSGWFLAVTLAKF